MADPITSYSTLVTAIQDAAEDVGTELLAFLPILIDNGENRLTREIDTLDLTYTSTVVVAASTAEFSKPAGHKLTNHVEYKDPTTGRSTVLIKKTDDYLAEYWRQPTSVGVPRYYSDEDKDTFRIAPCVSASASVKIRGVRRPTALTSAAPTNVFTSSMPDILFYSCMMDVGIWQRNEGIRAKYEALYTSTRDAVNNEGRRQRRDDGSAANNPESGQNTLLGD